MTIKLATKLPVIEEQLKTLNYSYGMVRDAAAQVIRAADGVKDERIGSLARTVESSAAEGVTSLNSALDICERLTAAASPITDEASAELGDLCAKVLDRLVLKDLHSFTELGDAVKNCSSVMKRLTEAVSDKISPTRLDRLSGIEFEALITRLLERMGFRAGMTKSSGDGGIDIVATLDGPVVGGKYLIQCKRYGPDSLIGAATVREFYGAVSADRRALKGILITTSGFTAQAEEFATGLPMDLIGRGQLERLLHQHGLLDAGVQTLHPLAQLGSAFRSIAETMGFFLQPSSEARRAQSKHNHEEPKNDAKSILTSGF